MAFMMAALPYLAAGLTVAGGVASANAANAAAKATKQQLDYQAGQTEAAGQREAEARRRKAALMVSRAVAVGAASGAGTSGIEGALAGIAEEGEKDAGGAIYESTEAAKGMRYKGAVGVAEAKAQGRATILSSVGQAGLSLAGKFGSTPKAPASGLGYWSSYDPAEAAKYLG